MNYIEIKNHQTIPLSSIPDIDYQNFMSTIIELMKFPENHCVSYYGVPIHGRVKLFCCIADDLKHCIYITSTVCYFNITLPSLSAHIIAMERFEREIGENFNIQFTDHPWMKPLRYAHDRTDKEKTMRSYPFYHIDSEELHEVGVGPIHAGIIEPGHFRFLCNGEQILHLEIQLGYQHRGIERLFVEKKKILQRATLAESIAGDTAVGHATAFSNLWESLCGEETHPQLEFERTLALELERLAIHTGDLSALCTDIAYQLGSSVYGRLRTPIINFFQMWCGNRLGKSLIRPGKTNFPFTKELAQKLGSILELYERDFLEMSDLLFNLPSTLARFEKTGIVTTEQVKSIGAVGMSARMSNVLRDIRTSHPDKTYRDLNHQPILKEGGDVNARAQIRRDEIIQSMDYIRKLIRDITTHEIIRSTLPNPQANSFSLSLVEGWRGEISHSVVTDEKGDLLHYKIKDPSFHNWMALALAVRNNEISDFPISNKSFDLSYCGFDL